MAARSVRRVGLRRLEQAGLRARAEAALAGNASVRVDDRDAEVVVAAGDRDALAAAAGASALVVAVLPQADRRSAMAALDAGAHAVVLEAELEVSLGAAVEAVCSGLVVVPRAVRQVVRRPVLSSREKQVLSMVVIGLTNAEIGQRLHLAESTVKSHLSAIFGKLEVRSRKEAADLVLDPSSGLGAGILAITPARTPSGYSQPVVD